MTWSLLAVLPQLLVHVIAPAVGALLRPTGHAPVKTMLIQSLPSSSPRLPSATSLPSDRYLVPLSVDPQLPATGPTTQHLAPPEAWGRCIPSDRGAANECDPAVLLNSELRKLTGKRGSLTRKLKSKMPNQTKFA